VVEFRTLAISGVGDDEHVHSLTRHIARHDLVALAQPHPADPGRAATHRRTSDSAKRIASAAFAQHQQVVISAGPHDANELVAFIQLMAMKPSRRDLSYSENAVFFT